MSEQLVIGLAAVGLLGVGAQWLAWRLRLPAILLLLLFGLLAGPLTGRLDPDALLGALLLPIVSLSVALILFEGGMSLRLSELREHGHIVRNLVTVGVAITWLVAAAAAWLCLGFGPRLALLTGAVAVVTGPTVIVPLLRHVQVRPPLGSLLRWEGIVIDPVGALLAVLVFEVLVAAQTGQATALALKGFAVTLVVGGAIGLAAAALLVVMLERRWLPEFLHNPATLVTVLGGFVLANHAQAESGLFTVTLMGLALANQKRVNVDHIIEFEENLRVLLISGLFILLAARLELDKIRDIGPPGLLFVAVLIFVARPLSVWACTLGSGLGWRERAFLACMAPRGIVAAAVASVFGLALAHSGWPLAESLVPVMFLVILVTIAFYGLIAAPAAALLGVKSEAPQGLLIVGASPWACAFAAAVSKAGFRVRLVDTNWGRVAAARMQGLPAVFGSALSERLPEELDLDGIGRLVALTPNDVVNALVAQHFKEYFGARELYQTAVRPGTSGRGELARERRARELFETGIDHDTIAGRFAAGARVKTTRLTQTFDEAAFKERYGGSALTLCVVTASGELRLATTDAPLAAKAGSTLIALVTEPAGELRGGQPGGDAPPSET